MGLRRMLENTDLKKIVKPIIPSKYEFTTNLGWNIEAFSKNYQELAPNNLSDKGNARLVGTAFDYMARFIIAKNIEHNKKMVLEDMLCEKAFDILAVSLNEKELEYYQMCYTEAVMMVEDYIVHRTNSYYNILHHAFLFANLEQIQRASLMVDAQSVLKHNYMSDTELEEDLKKNCEVFEQAFITSGIVKKDSVVVFNPHFGIWSVKCFGADADVFIDGVLYDFKCTPVYGYRSKDVAQICGYYLLHRLSKIENDKEYEELAPIKNMDFKAIALYKSRFGAIERYDVSKFEKEKFEGVMEQAKMFIDKYYDNTMKFSNFMKRYLKDGNDENE